MNLNTALKTATGTALLVCVASIGSSTASDLKTGGGANCMPYGANTTWGELTFRPSGVTNEGTVNEHILCSIVTDSENTWTTDADVDVEVMFKTQTEAPINCTATRGSALGLGSNSVNGTNTLAPNTVGTVYMSNLIDDDANGYYFSPLHINCRLPPKTTVLRIVVTENGFTNYDPPPPEV